MKTTNAGNAMPKHASGMCTANESACICRASNRYSWSTGANGAAARRIALTFGTVRAGRCSKRFLRASKR